MGAVLSAEHIKSNSIIDNLKPFPRLFEVLQLRELIINEVISVHIV